MFPKLSQNKPRQFSLENDFFQNSPKRLQYVWATFVRKFVTNKLQKSPNMVTMLVENGVIFFVFEFQLTQENSTFENTFSIDNETGRKIHLNYRRNSPSSSVSSLFWIPFLFNYLHRSIDRLFEWSSDLLQAKRSKLTFKPEDLLHLIGSSSRKNFIIVDLVRSG